MPLAGLHLSRLSGINRNQITRETLLPFATLLCSELRRKNFLAVLEPLFKRLNRAYHRFILAVFAHNYLGEFVVYSTS